MNEVQLAKNRIAGHSFDVKTLLTILAVSLLSFVANAGDTNHVDSAQAVRAAIFGFREAVTNSWVLVRPTGKGILAAQLSKTNNQPRHVFSLVRFAQNLRTVDVSGCPQEFRVDWFEAIHTLENYSSKGNLRNETIAKLGVLGIAAEVASGAGVVTVGATAKAAQDAHSKVVTEDDVRLAFQKLEIAGIKYCEPN